MQEVFYDLRFVRTDFHDGISRFSFELAKAYLKINPRVVFLSTRKNYKKHAEMLDLMDYEVIEAGQKLRPFEDNQTRFCLMTDPEDGLKELKSGKLLAQFIPRDIQATVFSPMQTLQANPKYKLILSLHDTIYYHHRTPPKNHPWHVRLGWRLFYSHPIWQRQILNKANAIVTVSKTSEIAIRQLDLTDRPIYVIYNAPPSNLEHKQPFPPIKKVDNLLYVGTSVPYKNVKTLVEAMQFLPGKKLYLAILNIPKNVRRELKAIVDKKGGVIEFVGNLSEKDVDRLYRGNTVFVSASKEEGFGIPALEAALRGRPSILSDISAFREVAGDSAWFFNPRGAFELSTLIRDLESQDIEKKCGLAVKNARRFSWDKSATSLQKVIEEVSK